MRLLTNAIGCDMVLATTVFQFHFCMASIEIRQNLPDKLKSFARAGGIVALASSVSLFPFRSSQDVGNATETQLKTSTPGDGVQGTACEGDGTGVVVDKAGSFDWPQLGTIFVRGLDKKTYQWGPTVKFPNGTYCQTSFLRNY